MFHYHQQVVKTNWKLWQDNNTESYHIFLHNTNRKMTTFDTRHWYFFRNGHYLLPPDSKETITHHMSRAGIADRMTHVFPGLGPNQLYRANFFPDVTFVIRTTVMRVDRCVPISPGETLVEYWGVGLKSDTPEVRALRLEHHNTLWGPFGRNLPEDIAASESQYRAIQTGALRYSIFAREADLRSDDDEVSRIYYRHWGELMGRKASDPFGEYAE
jgi:hypothetical protein